MASGFLFEEMTQSRTHGFSSHPIGANAASRGVSSCKEVWEMQALVGQSSAYLNSGLLLLKQKSGHWGQAAASASICL